MRQYRVGERKELSSAAEILGAILGALVAVLLIRLDLVGRLAAWIGA